MLDPLLLRFGVLSTAQVDALGWTKRERAAAVAQGRLVSVRHGWLARPSLDRPHARRGAHHRGGSERPWCRPYGAQPPVAAAVDEIDVAFRCLLRCGTAEEVVVADSLLHLRRATRDELERWCEGAPMRVRALLARVDAAESGLESIVRLRLRSMGVAVRTQVWIGRRRVDLLVGERLVIECDGAEHHASWEAHAADRARDRALAAQGHLVVRLTYGQVLREWPAVADDLRAIVRRGDHRAPRRRIHG